MYGVAIAEERDNVNEIFDYATSKPYIENWSAAFAAQTGGKSLGNLRAMHQGISAGKVTELNFDDEAKAVHVSALVVDDGEWKKVLAGVYTGFSFGGRAIRRWDDDQLNAVRYTLQPTELSLADKPCVPSAVFEVVKTDGRVEKRPFKHAGGKDIMIKIEKNMDMTQFLELMNNVKEGLAADEKTPPELLEAVNQLIEVLANCTGGTAKTEEEDEAKAGAEEKTVASGCETEKVDLAAEIQKAFAPLAKSLEGVAGVGEAIGKVTKSLDDMQKRIEKIENLPAAPKVFKGVPKTNDGKDEPNADPSAAALEQIKKAHNFETCAY